MNPVYISLTLSILAIFCQFAVAQTNVTLASEAVIESLKPLRKQMPPTTVDAAAAVQRLGVLYKTTFAGNKSIYDLAVAINELFKSETDLANAENQIKNAETQAQKKEAAAEHALTVGSSLTGPQPRQASIYIEDAKKIRQQAISIQDNAKKNVLQRIKDVERLAITNISSGNKEVAAALCSSLYAVLDRALPGASSLVSVPRNPINSENQITHENAALNPHSTLIQNPDSERLEKTALTLFPERSKGSEAVRDALSKIPGIEKKAPDVACRILENFCRIREQSLIQSKTLWSQYDKMLAALKSIGIKGDCPSFASEQFAYAIKNTQASLAKSKHPLDWDDPVIQKQLDFWFQEVLWSLRREEVRLLIAFGAAIYEQPWIELANTRLKDESILGDRIKALRDEVENGHSLDIQFKIESILEQLPPSIPFTEAQVWNKARSEIYGEDLEKARTRGLLPMIITLHGRSARYALACRVAALLEKGEDKVPSKLNDPTFIHTMLEGCTNIEEAENPYTIATELMKLMPELKAKEAMEIARITVRSIAIAIKELTNN